MDTKTALLTLQTLSQNLGAEINSLTLQKSAVDVAVAQLQGLLDTPSADLVEAQKTIADLTEQAQTLTEQLATPAPAVLSPEPMQ